MELLGKKNALFLLSILLIDLISFGEGYQYQQRKKFQRKKIDNLNKKTHYNHNEVEDSNPYRHIQVVDPAGKYVLQWEVDWEKERVIFNVKAKTRGYIGFGLSKKGFMDSADIVIGGVDKNGNPYFTDRHGKGHEVPEIDESQDYTLHEAWEKNSYTFLSFSRAFETCDSKNDFPITEHDVISIMWAYGEKDDELEYHHHNKGSINAYILDPDLTPREVIQQQFKNVTVRKSLNPPPTGDWKVWRIPMTYVMPQQDTIYLCTFHKAPESRTGKQHIVGIRPVFNELERKHIHHFLLHVCYPPEGVDPNVIFGRHEGQPGQECYVLPLAENIPGAYCLEIRHEWAVGGESLFLPESVGMPLSATPNEYWMVQVHYDNPLRLPNIRLQFSIEIFYTPKLRQHDGGMIAVGNVVNGPTIVIPPYSRNHVIYGHCATKCTEKMIGKNGVNVFATRLHTHLTGVGARLMYIHDQKEMALSIDDNYNFNYQAYRILRKEIKLSPGDMLYSRCLFDTTDRENVTVGGYSTRHEMCHGFYWYYPYNPSLYTVCASELRSDVYRDLLQVYNVTWSNSVRENIVTSPAHLAGLTTPEAFSRIDWTIDKRTQLQTHQRFIPPISNCATVGPDNVFVGLGETQGAANNQSPKWLRPPSSRRGDLGSGRGVQGQDSSSERRSSRLLGSRTRKEQGIRRENSNDNRLSTTTTYLDKEIIYHGQEFVSLWPEILMGFSKESRCPKTV